MTIVLKRLSGLILTIILVTANAILLEIILDIYGIEWHRLFTGIFGTLLIVLSFGYSLRKRKILITFGNPMKWLICHEWLTIIGTFVILVHTGTHFKALVPISTLFLMSVAFISGLVGKFVYNNAREELKVKKSELSREGLGADEIEERLWSLTVASGALSKWRKLHKPVIVLFALMVVYHAVSALYYRGF